MSIEDIKALLTDGIHHSEEEAGATGLDGVESDLRTVGRAVADMSDVAGDITDVYRCAYQHGSNAKAIGIIALHEVVIKRDDEPDALWRSMTKASYELDEIDAEDLNTTEKARQIGSLLHTTTKSADAATAGMAATCEQATIAAELYGQALGSGHELTVLALEHVAWLQEFHTGQVAQLRDLLEPHITAQDVDDSLVSLLREVAGAKDAVKAAADALGASRRRKALNDFTFKVGGLVTACTRLVEINPTTYHHLFRMKDTGEQVSGLVQGQLELIVQARAHVAGIISVAQGMRDSL